MSPTPRRGNPPALQAAIERSLAKAGQAPAETPLQRVFREAAATPEPEPEPRKYRNQPCEVEGEKFDSKLEAEVWQGLKREPWVRAVVRQVSIPCGILKRRLRVDFLAILEVRPDGTFVGELIDAKGVETDAWRLKAEALEQSTGIRVRRIGKAKR